MKRTENESVFKRDYKIRGFFCDLNGYISVCWLRRKIILWTVLIKYEAYNPTKNLFFNVKVYYVINHFPKNEIKMPNLAVLTEGPFALIKNGKLCSIYQFFNKSTSKFCAFKNETS